MPVYVNLMKLTEQGAKGIKEAPARLQAGTKAWEAMGGKVIGIYAVMGEYDYVTIGEAPNDEVATTFSMGLSALGNVQTKTLHAFTLEEFSAMAKKLP